MRGATPVSPVNSYAVGLGDRVDVVLADPVAPLDAGRATVVLRRGDQRMRAAASLVDGGGRGRRLVATFAAGDLTDGQYLLLVRGGGSRVKPGVRLLVQGDLPLVLRWGDRVSTVEDRVS